MISSRKFLKIVFISFIAFTVAVGAFNLIVNPYSEFSWEIFLPGTPLVRRYKTDLIDRTRPPLGYVVLGSSRLQSLDPEAVFPGKKGINIITFNPYMDDIYAVWKYLLKTKGPPEGAIIGLQVAFFKPGLLEDAVLYGDGKLSGEIKWTMREIIGYEFMRFRRIFRLYAAWNSIGVLNNTIKGKGYFLKFDERGMAYVPGGRVSAGALGKPPQKEIDRRYKSVQSRLEHIREIQYRNFHKIDERRLAMLEEILSDMEKYHVKAYAITMPIHPYMLEISRRMTPFEQWQTSMKDLCAKHHIPLYDYVDVTKLDWLPTWEFVDCDHLSEKAIKVFEIKLRDDFAAGNDYPEQR